MISSSTWNASAPLAAPRRLGFDEQGRDVLSWIDGGTYSDCRAIAWSDEQLASSARLLSRHHDAVASAPLAVGEEVVCHGDFGPWNLIWRAGLPVAVIDFDTARPGPRLDDIGYALWKHLNLGRVDLRSDQQASRARVFIDAYGIEVDVAAAIELAREQARARFTEHGWAKTLVELAAERAWLGAHRAAFG